MDKQKAKRIVGYLFSKKFWAAQLISKKQLSKLLPDKVYLKLQFYVLRNKKLNLKNPKTFQEKLQWLKLNDRKEIYHQMVDKYDAKSFIEKAVGKQYNIPTLGVWDSFEEIDFDLLPEKFILKPTFDSGSYYICYDKHNIQKAVVKKRLYQNWGRSYYWQCREWPYKGLRHRIIAEPLLSDPQKLKEFKFFCFNGKPIFFQSISERSNAEGPILQCYDINCNRLDIKDAHYKSRQNSDIKNVLPTSLEKMINVSKTLSEGTYFIRVDFYEVEGIVYVGELTFYESGGYCEFVPEKYNEILGDWIKLPIDK